MNQQKVTLTKGLKIFRGDKEACLKQPIIDKQFVIDVETPLLYVDVKRNRIPLCANLDIDLDSLFDKLEEIQDKIDDISAAGYITEEQASVLITEKVINILSGDNPISREIESLKEYISENTMPVDAILDGGVV